LIQASMVGTPSVSTSMGTEGLPLRHDEHVLVADDQASFAAAIERLIEDRALWERLAEAGRKAVLARHGRGIVRAQIDDLLARVISRPPRALPG
jgi:glycosyltransferase involved in cell wall biosynthesis